MTQNQQDDNTRGISGTMVAVAWIVALVFMAYLFQQILDDRYNPNQGLDENLPLGETREVVLERNAQGHYVANGLINGHRVTFLVDTGATDVALPESLAKQLRLPKQTGGFSQTANGTIAVWGTTLRSVQLGIIQLKQVRATIVPGMEADSPVLLGMSFLKQLELIQREGRLTLRQEGANG